MQVKIKYKGMKYPPKIGRPVKKNAMRNAISVKLPPGALGKLKVVAAHMRLPVATMVRNWVLDKLEGKK
jgi:hypothetical protein